MAPRLMGAATAALHGLPGGPSHALQSPEPALREPRPADGKRRARAEGAGSGRTGKVQGEAEAWLSHCPHLPPTCKPRAGRHAPLKSKYEGSTADARRRSRGFWPAATTSLALVVSPQTCSITVDHRGLPSYQHTQPNKRRHSGHKLTNPIFKFTWICTYYIFLLWKRWIILINSSGMWNLTKWNLISDLQKKKKKKIYRKNTINRYFKTFLDQNVMLNIYRGKNSKASLRRNRSLTELETRWI